MIDLRKFFKGSIYLRPNHCHISTYLYYAFNRDTKMNDQKQKRKNHVIPRRGLDVEGSSTRPFHAEERERRRPRVDKRERVSRVHSLENRATNKKPPQVPVSTAWLLLLAYTFIDRPDTGPSLIFDSAEREIHSLPETRPAGPAPPPSKNQRLPTATANTESR